MSSFTWYAAHLSSGHSSSLYHVLMTVPVAHSPMLHSIRSPTSYITRHSASYAAQYEALPCAHFARGKPYEGIHAEAQTETAPGTVTRREEPRETRACGKHTHTHTHTHAHTRAGAARVPGCPTPHPQLHTGNTTATITHKAQAVPRLNRSLVRGVVRHRLPLLTFFGPKCDTRNATPDRLEVAFERFPHRRLRKARISVLATGATAARGGARPCPGFCSGFLE